MSKSKIALICYTEYVEIYRALFSNADVYDLGAEHDYKTHANRLFSLLRRADRVEYECMYAPLPVAKGMGLALYNRMIRAAAHQIMDTEEL